MLKKDKQVGEYVLIEKLGTGGFGEVWKAEKRTVLSTSLFAIKFFRAEDEESLDTGIVKKEVETWQRLSGLPHVISVIEGNTFEEYIYIVSEYADGGSLEKWLNANGGKANSYNEAVAITSQILNGLESMHSEGFVHRDLKPANVLLKRNILYLADFGISRQMKTHSKSTGTAGTYEYMPPEAFEGKPLVSPHTDIWATGVILQRLLTGQLPFPQEEIPSLMAAIIMRDPEPMDEAVPASLRAIVKKALQKKPVDRFQSAREMLEALHNPQAFLEKQMMPQVGKSPATVKVGSNPTNKDLRGEVKAGTPANDQQTNQAPKIELDEQSSKNIVAPPEDAVSNKQQVPPSAVTSEPSARRSKSYLMFIVPAVLVGFILIGLAGLAIWKFTGNSSNASISNSNQSANNDDANTDTDVVKKLSDVDYYNQGNECLGKKDYDCAIKNFTEAINMTPNYPEAYYGRGMTYMSRGDNRIYNNDPEPDGVGYEQAIKDFSKAIELKTDYAEAYVGRGNAYAKKNVGGENAQYSEESVKDFNRAIKLKDEYLEAYTGLGNAYKNFGEFDKALQEYNKVIEINPYYADAFVGRAETYGSKYKYAQAVTEISKAIDLDPGSAENYRLRGYFNEMLKKDAQAIADYRKALEIDPNYKSAQTSLEAILDK